MKPTKCFCGSISWERSSDGRFLCCSCKRPLWQDIETAPKDGRMIFAYAFPFALVAWWGIGKGVNEWYCDMYDTAIDPTHWMPLPEPPDDGTS